MKPAILVVDDDPAVCDVLQDALGEHQLKVYCCHQGKEALLMLSTHPEITLVMLDMMLPDTNGLLVLQQLQRQRPEVLVIMLTGMGSEAEMVVGLEMGADDYIAKPFNPRVVVARTRAACGACRPISAYSCRAAGPSTRSPTASSWCASARPRPTR